MLFALCQLASLTEGSNSSNLGLTKILGHTPFMRTLQRGFASTSFSVVLGWEMGFLALLTYPSPLWTMM